ncbi:MAG: hypothetical protein LBT12_06780 [Oscillospiraceae bacterium]|jgi:hypothetical protein|nr:hypothetical protein [Oscillospiraceae bacterium]
MRAFFAAATVFLTVLLGTSAPCGELVIQGTVRVAELYAPGGVYVAEGGRLIVDGGVFAGDHLEAHGGAVEVRGGVRAARVWLENADAEISGVVTAEYYTQSGGAAALGGLAARSIVLTDYYTDGETVIHVSGEISGELVTEDVPAVGFDETALTSFEYARSSRRPYPYVYFDHYGGD